MFCAIQNLIFSNVSFLLICEVGEGAAREEEY